MIQGKVILIIASFIMIFNTGCVSLATSVATQTGVQVAGEQYLISQNKPMIKCNVINLIKGNKVCRVSRTYLIRRA